MSPSGKEDGRHARIADEPDCPAPQGLSAIRPEKRHSIGSIMPGRCKLS